MNKISEDAIKFVLFLLFIEHCMEFALYKLLLLLLLLQEHTCTVQQCTFIKPALDLTCIHFQHVSMPRKYR